MIDEEANQFEECFPYDSTLFVFHLARIIIIIAFGLTAARKMSRAAKQIAMRLMALESDSEEDDDFTPADDDFHDVGLSVELPSTHDDQMDNVTSDSDEDDEPDIGGDVVSDNTTPVEVLIGRNNTEWSVIDENAVFPGRASRENILRPAPGLTTYAFQRLRDNPVLDSFLIFFSTGK